MATRGRQMTFRYGRRPEGHFVLNGEYIWRGLLAGMKGFFTPYANVYEAITGKRPTTRVTHHITISIPVPHEHA